MKNIKDLDLKNKKVIIRVDFNVPIKDGVILDDNRINESLDTIKYVIKREAKVILMSHLGRVKTEEDKVNNNLLPVCELLSEKLGKKVIFVNETRGKELEDAINNLQNGDVLLMQNTRYEDLDGKKESSNDSELGEYWASLGDIFINDAFGTCHRAHASNVGIASHLPCAPGFLVKKELDNILPAINSPKRPLTVILGGAKVSDKIGLIENLLKKADYILIGGAMAYTFMKARNEEIGKSLVDLESIDYCCDLLNKTNKIILPVDHICSDNIESKNAYIKDKMEINDIGFDIGPKTIELFKQYIQKSETVIWNGPVGMFENNLYSNGTNKLCDIIAKHKCISIIGGGDTASGAINFGYKTKFTHISTGGGASLELIEGKDLPGISILN